MKTPAEYLETAKILDLAAEMRAAGFSVRLGPDAGPSGYDLVAEKPGRRIAVEVKAQKRLKEAAPQINLHRRQAREEGFDEFRLVVVHPPREKQIHVENLERKLVRCLRENSPARLDSLSSHVVVIDVADIELTRADLSSVGIRLEGSGLVEVELGYGGETEQEAVYWNAHFPFQLTATLGGEALEIEAASFEFDFSGNYE